MALVLASLFVALFVWWAATGAIIYGVVGFEREHGVIVIGSAIAAALGLAGLIISSGMVTVFGAYLAFASALLVWAFFEVTFLTGYLTGPRRIECPRDALGLKRFRLGVQTVLHHELALIAMTALLATTLWTADNRVGLVTFALLWVMRLSAKLVLFLGARHALSEMMPTRLAYLQTYFRTDRTSAFFPITVAASLAVLMVVILSAMQSTTAFGDVAHTLIATFLLLAIAEHFILVLPIADTALWRGFLARLEDRSTRPSSTTLKDVSNGVAIVAHTADSRAGGLRVPI